MKRLTGYNRFGGAYGIGIRCGDNEEVIHNIIKRLAEYEDLEEQGRLIELPCPIGATIWMIVTKRPKVTMPEFSFVKQTRLRWSNVERVLRDFGESVFLTRKQAEEALVRTQMSLAKGGERDA